MEKLIPKKINISNINGGNKFVNGDIVTATTINDIIQGIAAVPSTDSGSTGGGEIVVGSSVRRTVLWEGNLNDSELKTYFNSNNTGDRYYLRLNNLPQSISDDSYLIIEMKLLDGEGESFIKIKKNLINVSIVENNSKIFNGFMVAASFNGNLGSFQSPGETSFICIYDIFASYLVKENAAQMGLAQDNCLVLEPISVNYGRKSGSIFNTNYKGMALNATMSVTPINNAENQELENTFSLSKVTLVEVL